MCPKSPFPRRLGDPPKFGEATSSVLEKPRRRHLANKHGCNAHGCSREYHYLVVTPPSFGGSPSRRGKGLLDTPPYLVSAFNRYYRWGNSTGSLNLSLVGGLWILCQ